MADGTFRHKNGFTAVPILSWKTNVWTAKALTLYVMIQAKYPIPDSSWIQGAIS